MAKFVEDAYGNHKNNVQQNRPPDYVLVQFHATSVCAKIVLAENVR
jgi:hypothetical protein